MTRVQSIGHSVHVLSEEIVALHSQLEEGEMRDAVGFCKSWLSMADESRAEYLVELPARWEWLAEFFPRDPRLRMRPLLESKSALSGLTPVALGRALAACVRFGCQGHIGNATMKRLAVTWGTLANALRADTGSNTKDPEAQLACRVVLAEMIANRCGLSLPVPSAKEDETPEVLATEVAQRVVDKHPKLKQAFVDTIGQFIYKSSAAPTEVLSNNECRPYFDHAMVFDLVPLPTHRKSGTPKKQKNK